MGELIDVVASGIGGLTNPTKIENTFKTVKGIGVGKNTIKQYLEMLEESFLIRKAVRYDVKGRKYIDTPQKYYFEDLGLRNARIGFRQVEKTHLMENMVYNELCLHGYTVDVGVVTHNTKDAEGRSQRVQLEVDFVCNRGPERIYIQSAYALPDKEKAEQEQASLLQIKDGFRKVIIVADRYLSGYNEEGIRILSLRNFLMDGMVLDYMFPSLNGDCILVEYVASRYILIDGGYVDTYKAFLLPKLVEIADNGGVIDVLAVTHIDRDHISGIIRMLEEDKLPISIKEIWYNGYKHVQSSVHVSEEDEIFVHKDICKETRSVNSIPISAKQGCTLSTLINRKGLLWNRPANGNTMKGLSSYLLGDATIHILSPNSNDISKFIFF